MAKTQSHAAGSVWRSAVERAREVRRRALRPLDELRRQPITERWRRAPRWSRWAIGAAVLLVVAVALSNPLADRYLGPVVVKNMNDRLDGYTASVGDFDFNTWNLSVELLDLSITQDERPDPPVVKIARTNFNVQWRSLFLGHVVADWEVDSPRFHVDLTTFENEWNDEKDIEERGWQAALKEVYPLEINELRLTDGELTYIDDPERPLRFSKMTILARNIRNIRYEDREYPSEVWAQGTVFDRGHADLRGTANFLAEPYPGLKLEGDFSDVPVEPVGPVLEHWNLAVNGGILNAHGELEYAPWTQRLHLDRAVIDGIRLDYRNDPELTQVAVEAVAEAGQDPGMLFRIDELRLTDAELGFASTQGFRVYVSDAETFLRNLSNEPNSGDSQFEAHGAFMGSGDAKVSGTFRPDTDGADFDVNVAVESTDLTRLNDMLRALLKVDVAAGRVSLWSEVAVSNGKVQGYIKPLFQDVDVYEPEQDRGGGFLHNLWERIAGGLAKVLVNRKHDTVATVVDLSGDLENPKADNVEVMLKVIQNAFFDAILPGFQNHLEKGDVKFSKRAQDKAKKD